MKSFKTAFKSVYEKGLMQYGFCKVKGTQPYYARCIGDEIVHVITFQEDISSLNCKGFTILFGVVTVYRKKIAFDEPTKFSNDWLSELSSICFNENYYPMYDRRAFDEMIPFRFEYDKFYEETMMNAIIKSFALTEKYAIPVLDKITTLEECIKYFFKYKSVLLRIEASDEFVKTWLCGEHNEGLLSIQIYRKNRFKEYEDAWRTVVKRDDDNELYRIKAGLSGLTMEQYRNAVIERKEWLQERLNTFQIMANDSEWQDKICKELKQRKNNNLETLEKYGFMVKIEEEN